MIVEIKELWIKALRSGKFQQGKEMLAYQDDEVNGGLRYCCLGVLCHLYNREKKKGWENLHIDGDEILPTKVALWAGLTSQNPDVVHAKHKATLSTFNDGMAYVDDNTPIKQLNFNEIADLIEAQL